ncbi:uncharacterized protein CDV56_101873 [Aspergillus thermomutatus]|uniref:Uncharacterized protein n=1 Tax=Aspergillus thermomutatus TaxID=41047 RepID=A0A397GJD9_ASPTH|nr:uncharacterized protein CDV56_101873 [Aspergillus thermomutatus]RHZ50299.1 hypothetical protein CDV56_101873 [Aspergillus thermomutatus]
MPSGPPQIGPEPDILTGAIRSHCNQCYHLLRDQINFPVLRFNDFGWSFLGLALTVGCHEIARDIAHHINDPGHVTGSANVKQVGSPRIITLALQTGDKTIFEPIYNQIPAQLARETLSQHVTPHERAQLCRNSTPDLADRLLQDGCNIADGVDSNTHDTSWHYGIENPCGIPFMQFLRRNQTGQVSKNRANANGETPLMKAVRSKRLDMVRWLTDISVDVKHEAFRGTTARTWLQSFKAMRKAQGPYSMPWTLGYGERRKIRRQYRNRVYKKYREISGHEPDRTLTYAAGLTAAQYASRFGLRELATYINREPYNLRPR